MRWVVVLVWAVSAVGCSLARQPLTPARDGGVDAPLGIDADLDGGVEDLDVPIGMDVPVDDVGPIDAPEMPDVPPPPPDTPPPDAPVVCPPCAVYEVCGPVGACIPRPAPTVTTDRASYTRGDPMIITLSGMPGDPQDFIAIAPVGAAPGAYVNWIYTGGITSGTVMWNTVTGGVSPDSSFTIRAFYANMPTQRGESAPFFVAF